MTLYYSLGHCPSTPSTRNQRATRDITSGCDSPDGCSATRLIKNPSPVRRQQVLPLPHSASHAPRAPARAAATPRPRPGTHGRRHGRGLIIRFGVFRKTPLLLPQSSPPRNRHHFATQLVREAEGTNGRPDLGGLPCGDPVRHAGTIHGSTRAYPEAILRHAL